MRQKAQLLHDLRGRGCSPAGLENLVVLAQSKCGKMCGALDIVKEGLISQKQKKREKPNFDNKRNLPYPVSKKKIGAATHQCCDDFGNSGAGGLP